MSTSFTVIPTPMHHSIICPMFSTDTSQKTNLKKTPSKRNRSSGKKIYGGHDESPPSYDDNTDTSDVSFLSNLES
jgi:hypothetical protein